MPEPQESDLNFDASLGCLISPHLRDLAAQLSTVSGLASSEAEVVAQATRTTLYQVLHGKLARVLLLELNAMRMRGTLAGTPHERWIQFLEYSSGIEFWRELEPHYPSLLARVDTLARNRCLAALEFSRHWSDDRPLWRALIDPSACDELTGLRFGAGDSHLGGRSVAIAELANGEHVIYKPRSLAGDVALREFVDALRSHHASLSVGVPRSVAQRDHGWSEFIVHRYAPTAEEVRDFYRGIGHWIAIMRLLGASDLHAENLIAHAATPFVIDCETLFTPPASRVTTVFGDALDCAMELSSGSVLNLGLLPGRGMGLGWRGVDTSGVGMLNDQQPTLTEPGIVAAGTDEARIGKVKGAVRTAQNHPAARPALAQYWPDVLAGFEALDSVLRRLDREAELEPLIEGFRGCTIRIVPRPTESYAELGRMLWHPVSLHKPQDAKERAASVMARMARNLPDAPGEASIIQAEIEDLLVGDIPIFTASAHEGWIDGPRGQRWRAMQDPLAVALSRWRNVDHALDRRMIQASLVSAYLNEGVLPEAVSMLPTECGAGDLDTRRRAQAARIVSQLLQLAIRGNDGTVTWIAPVMSNSGWSVQPVTTDLYNGLAGMALLVSAYRREVAAGRADPVQGLDDIHRRILRSLQLFDRQLDELSQTTDARMPPVGCYTGLGSEIWAYLAMERMGHAEGAGLTRAIGLSEHLVRIAGADANPDLLSGIAGAIAALLMLHRADGSRDFLAQAITIADRLCSLAKVDTGRASWPTEEWPQGVGGFAHGVTGIAWTLAKLAKASGERRFEDMARAGFAFEESLYDEAERNWLDLRHIEDAAPAAAAWCHGSAGIGLAHIDLDPGLSDPINERNVRRAVAATCREGFGWNHCLCHGDFGNFELLQRASAYSFVPSDFGAHHLLDRLVTSLEIHGPSCGVANDAFIPGLMPGIGGIAYQLLRAHPDSDLPSLLVPHI